MSHLSPTHHKTSKHDSPHETRTKVKLPKCPRFEFKPWHVNDSSHTNQRTGHLVSQKICQVFAEAFISHGKHTLFTLEESVLYWMTYACES
jgi:hypothetical protein